MPMREIGKGEADLLRFVVECIEASGHPTVVDHYGALKFDRELLVRCFGASTKVPGGIITGLSPDTVEKARRRKLDAVWIVSELAPKHPEVKVPDVVYEKLGIKKP